MIPTATNITKEEVDFYLFDLKTKFSKINFDEYVLSYSGGKDSHLLYWFIKEYMKDDKIQIVGVNTRMEHPQIAKRIKENCDIVLLPEFRPHEVVEKYGSPCYSKLHDEYIKRYQNGSRAASTMKYVARLDENTRFRLPKEASELLLNGELHRISSKCCDYLKKKPMAKYLKETNKKLIIGVKAEESQMRKARYKGCFTSDGKFSPLWDLTEEMEDAIYFYYQIDIPPIYEVLDRTGCMGCPYGKNIEQELQTLSDNQYKYVLSMFQQSYDVKGVNYQKN